MSAAQSAPIPAGLVVRIAVDGVVTSAYDGGDVPAAADALRRYADAIDPDSCLHVEARHTKVNPCPACGRRLSTWWLAVLPDPAP